MSLLWVYVLLAAVVVQRGIELVYSRRNAARLIAEKGGIEVAPEQYPYLVGFHALWLVTMILVARPTYNLHAFLLIVFFVLQVLRYWTIRSLGPYWTTRIINVPDEPLVRHGPYRFLNHPNYLIVAIEIPLLPVILDMPLVAILFGAVNLVLLYFRMDAENRAISDRRSLKPLSG